MWQLQGWLANVCGLPPAFRAVPSLAPPVLPQLPPEPETRPQLHLDSQSSLPQDVPSPDQSYVSFSTMTPKAVAVGCLFPNHER